MFSSLKSSGTLLGTLPLNIIIYSLNIAYFNIEMIKSALHEFKIYI